MYPLNLILFGLLPSQVLATVTSIRGYALGGRGRWLFPLLFYEGFLSPVPNARSSNELDLNLILISISFYFCLIT